MPTSYEDKIKEQAKQHIDAGERLRSKELFSVVLLSEVDSIEVKRPLVGKVAIAAGKGSAVKLKACPRANANGAVGESCARRDARSTRGAQSCARLPAMAA